jgi:hypothetical protein
MTDEGDDDDDVSSSIPLFVDCSNEYLSMMDESVVHADAGYEVTSVELQQMVNHIRSSSPEQFVNHCLRERQRHRYEDHEVESLEVDLTTTGDDMMYRTSVAVIPI